jgi:hypothetical protein
MTKFGDAVMPYDGAAHAVLQPNEIGPLNPPGARLNVATSSLSRSSIGVIHSTPR